MKQNPFRAILISDFNAENFSGYLKNDSKFPKIIPQPTPFGQVTQVLIDEKMDCWKQSSDMAIVWTRPEGVIDSFRQALAFNPITINQVLNDVDAFSNSLLQLTYRVRTILVPSWTLSLIHI